MDVSDAVSRAMADPPGVVESQEYEEAPEEVVVRGASWHGGKTSGDEDI